MNSNQDFTPELSPDVLSEAHELAGEVIRRMLIWIADAPTLIDRGLRASVALHCLRPDLLGNRPTFDRLGDQAGRSRARVHQLAEEFRLLTSETIQP